MSAPIANFFGEYRFLSNFWYCDVQLDGVTYPSVEHAYQAAKTLCLGQRATIREAATPAAAKRLGKRVTMRPDWDQEKRTVMAGLCWQKFQYPDLREKLIATAPRDLIEGNTWGDVFWGVCRGKGHNYLGIILMNIRRELMIKMRTDLQSEDPSLSFVGVYTEEDLALALAQADATWRGE